jgi:flagellar biogenesis protein FliO
MAVSQTLWTEIMAIKNVILLLIVCCGILAGSSYAQPVGAEDENRAPSAEAEKESASHAEPGSMPLDLPTEEDKAIGIGKDGSDTEGAMWKMFASVVVVLVLGAACLVVTKKLLPRMGVRSGRQIQVVETMHLGPKAAVHLVRVGTKSLLVGATREGLTSLGDVTDAVADDADDLTGGAA